MRSPEAVEVAVEPKTKADQEKMSVALSRLAADSSTFCVTIDQESGQTIIKGTSELQLEVLVERLTRDFQVDANVGALQVAYRETLAKTVEVDFTHKKRTGPTYQFGRVKVQVAPGERGSGVQFFDEIKNGNIPREYIPSVEKGMRETAESGSLLGFPIIDIEIHLVDGAYHDVDSTALAFEITGRGAMSEAAQRAGIKLLEPIMAVEVVTPEDYLGDVIVELSSRRGGLIQSTENSDGATRVVAAIAPMASLFGFEKQLKSLTADEANISMAFDRYEFVPESHGDPDDTFPAAAALRA